MSRTLRLMALALAAAAVAVPVAQAQTDQASQPKIDPLAVSYLRGQGLTPYQIKARTVGVDPLAVSYLRGQGLSPSQVTAWTVGACANQVKPASCYTALGGNGFTAPRPAVDPLAASYLRGQGLTPDQVTAWTVGACSNQVKANSCYTALGGNALTTARPAVDPLAASYLRGMGLTASEIEAWTVGVCSHESRPTVCYAAFDRSAAPVQISGSGGFDWADAGIGAGATLGFVLLLSGLGAGLVISRRNRRQIVGM